VSVLVIASNSLAAGPNSWIGQIQGEVQLNGHPAKEGEKLEKGTVVKTGEGTATLFLGGQALARVGKQTETSLTQLPAAGSGPFQSELNIASGKLRALMKTVSPKSKFRVRTKAAVIGVRGTHVVVDSPAGAAPNFLVVEGKAEVAVQNGPTIALGALQKFEVGSSAPVTVTSEQARAAANSVAPEPASDSAAAAPAAMPAAESKAESSATVFDQIGSAFVVPLDPIADTATAKMSVNFKF
jgi:hypothetical protein